MSTNGQGTKCRRKIAEIYNRLSRVHKRQRETDRQTTDRRKRCTAPNFRPMSIVAKRLDGSRCHLVWMYRPQPRRHCVRRGPSSPKGTQPPHPQFSAHVCSGQTAGWIKMPLTDTEVGLGPRRHRVRWGLTTTPLPPKKGGGGTAPNFWPMTTVVNGRPSHLLLSCC